MGRRRADDEKLEALRAIFAQDIPHTDDTWTPPPKDEPLPEPPKVIIRGLGGPAVEVDAANLQALAQDAGGGFASDVSAEEYGRLLYQAKLRGSPLLVPLLHARAATPIYRFMTTEGRPWRPTPASITP